MTRLEPVLFKSGSRVCFKAIKLGVESQPHTFHRPSINDAEFGRQRSQTAIFWDKLLKTLIYTFFMLS